MTVQIAAILSLESRGMEREPSPITEACNVPKPWIHERTTHGKPVRSSLSFCFFFFLLLHYAHQNLNVARTQSQGSSTTRAWQSGCLAPAELGSPKSRENGKKTDFYVADAFARLALGSGWLAAGGPDPRLACCQILSGPPHLSVE